MVSNWPLILGIIASFLAVGNLLYTYFRTRVKGPKFVLVNTRIITYTKLEHETSDEYKEHFECTFNVKIMNVGDRRGILFLTSNELILDSIDNTFKSTPKEWDASIIADGDSSTTYTYYIPLKYQNWSKGKLILKGHYYDHKGSHKICEAKFKGENEKFTGWKPQMIRWKKLWMKIKCRSRTKQIVE